MGYCVCIVVVYCVCIVVAVVMVCLEEQQAQMLSDNTEHLADIKVILMTVCVW